jgi:hypothetical protein
LLPSGTLFAGPSPANRVLCEGERGAHHCSHSIVIPTGTSPTEMLRACVIVSYIPGTYFALKVFSNLTVASGLPLNEGAISTLSQSDC